MRASRRLVIALLVAALALAVRVALLHGFPHEQMRGDAGQNKLVATNLLAGHGFSHSARAPFERDGVRSPLYPLFLAAVGPTWEAAIFTFQCAMDLMTMWLIFNIGAPRIGPSRAAAAAAIYGLSPFPASFCSQDLAVSLTVMLFTAWLAMIVGHVRWWMSGIVGGLCGLTWAPLMPLMVGVYLWWARTRFREAIFSLAIVFVTMMPWAVRNWMAAGVPTPAPLVGYGAGLWQSIELDTASPIALPFNAGPASDAYATYLRQWSGDDVPLHEAIASEEALRQYALEAVMARPAAYASIALRQTADMWFSPDGALQNLMPDVVTLDRWFAWNNALHWVQRFVLLLALIGFLRNVRRPFVFKCTALFVGLTLIVGPIHAEGRYILPVYPEVCLLAAMCV